MSENVATKPVVYSADWCAYCSSLEQKLSVMNVEFTKKDVDEPGVREEMNNLTNGNQTIPVLFIGEEYWVNPDMGVLAAQFNKKA